MLVVVVIILIVISIGVISYVFGVLLRGLTLDAFLPTMLFVATLAVLFGSLAAMFITFRGVYAKLDDLNRRIARLGPVAKMQKISGAIAICFTFLIGVSNFAVSILYSTDLYIRVSFTLWLALLGLMLSFANTFDIGKGGMTLRVGLLFFLFGTSVYLSFGFVNTLVSNPLESEALGLAVAAIIFMASSGLVLILNGYLIWQKHRVGSQG